MVKMMEQRKEQQEKQAFHSDRLLEHSKTMKKILQVLMKV